MGINTRAMIRQTHTINGKNYSCYFKGNCGSDRVGDLVFFNGLLFGTSAWAYQTRIQRLLERFRIVMFDYPCQGDSSSLTDGFEAQDLIQDAVALAERLQVKSPLFIGHSFGGMLAGLVAAHLDIEAPQNIDVRGILISNSGLRSPRGTNKLFWEIQRRFGVISQSGLSQAAMNEAIKDIFRFFLPISLDDDYLAFIEDFEQDLLTGYADYNRDPEAVAYLLKILLNSNDKSDDFEQALARIRCPVQIVAGANDKIFPPRFSQELAASFDDCSVSVVENSGHSVMIEQNKIFNQKMLTFVDALYGIDIAGAIHSPMAVTDQS